MDQQDKTKPEVKADEPVELSNQDLEQVAGGLIPKSASVNMQIKGSMVNINLVDPAETDTPS